LEIEISHILLIQQNFSREPFMSRGDTSLAVKTP
jgi:hypothetical protein